VLFVVPAIWPFIFYHAGCKLLCRFLPHPIQKPWDFVFSQKRPYMLSIRLKSNEQIIGYFGGRSFASSNPSAEQIYLEKVYTLLPDGTAQEIPNTQGLIAFGSNIDFISLYKPAHTDEEKTTWPMIMFKKRLKAAAGSQSKGGTRDSTKDKKVTQHPVLHPPQSSQLQSGTSPSRSTHQPVTPIPLPPVIRVPEDPPLPITQDHSK
jgi:hypothetical protein